jgi:hypothetical protein
MRSCSWFEYSYAAKNASAVVGAAVHRNDDEFVVLARKVCDSTLSTWVQWLHRDCRPGMITLARSGFIVFSMAEGIARTNRLIT